MDKPADVNPRAVNSDAVNSRTSKNAIVQLAGRVLYLFTRVGLPPLILAYVSLAEYGIWAICFIVVGYMGMGAFGVSNVYIRYVAEFGAKGDDDAIARLVYTGIAATSVVAGILMLVLWLLIDPLVASFSIAPEHQDVARTLILGTAGIMMFDLTLGATAYVLHGLHRMAEQTVVWIISFMLEAALVVGFLLMDFGIIGLLWAFALRYLVATAGTLWLCKRYVPALTLSPKLWDKTLLSLFFRYGGVVQLSGMLGMVLYSIEKVIAGLTVGVAATGLFDVGQKLPVMSSQLTGSLNGSLLPAIAHHASRDDNFEVNKVLQNGMRAVALLTGVIMGFLAVFAEPLITAWIGPNEAFIEAAWLLAVFTVPFHAHVTTGPASMLFRGIGKPSYELAYPLAQAVLVAIGCALVALGPGFSLQSIAILVASSMTVSALGYAMWAWSGRGLSLGALLQRIWLPALLPYAIAWGVAYGARPLLDWAGDDRWLLLLAIGVSGVAYLAVVLPVGFALASGEERQWLRGRLQRAR